MKNGILKAMELEYKYVCRSRSDIFPENHLKFLEITRHLYQDKIMALCGVELNCNRLLSYYLDVILCGNIENMFTYFKNPAYNRKSYFRNTEQILLENYANADIHTREDVKLYMNFCKDICISEIVEIIWYRPDDWCVYYRTIPFTKLISEYCSAHFVYN